MNLNPQAFDLKRGYSLVVVGFFCLLPMIGVVFPRFLGIGPAVFGLLGLVGFCFLNREYPKIDRAYIIGAGGILGLCAMSAFWAIDPSFALERAGKIALILFGGYCLFILAHTMPIEMARRILRLFLFVFIGICTFCLFELFTQNTIYYLLRPDKLFLGDNLSNMNRGVVVITAFFFVTLIGFNQITHSAPQKWGRRIALVVMIVIVFQSHSQAAQVGFMGAIICYAALLVLPNTVQAIKMFGFVCAVLMSVVLLAMPWIVQAMFATLPPLMEDSAWLTTGASAPARMEIWDFIARRILESPIWGHGIEAARMTTDFETQKLYHPSNEILHPHNFMLQIWLEFGAIGAVLGCVLLNFILFVIFKCDLRAIKVYLPSYVLILIIAVLTYGLWQSWWLGLFTFILAMCVICVRAQKPQIEAS